MTLNWPAGSAVPAVRRAHPQVLPGRRAGLTDEEIVEVIANTVRNIFTNYVNEALDVDVEWPLVTPFAQVAA